MKVLILNKVIDTDIDTVIMADTDLRQFIGDVRTLVIKGKTYKVSSRVVERHEDLVAEVFYVKGEQNE